MSGTVETSFVLNGRVARLPVDPRMSLADAIRDEFGMTGTHLGCEHGVCGACTVFLDGHSARSCLVLAAQADGHEVVTVEGLDDDPDARRLASAMTRRHGLQCGFCTPGMLVSALELLHGDERPTEASVREALSGNVCRCTGYQGIVAAVLDAAVGEAGSVGDRQTDAGRAPVS